MLAKMIHPIFTSPDLLKRKSLALSVLSSPFPLAMIAANCNNADEDSAVEGGRERVLEEPGSLSDSLE